MRLTCSYRSLPSRSSVADQFAIITTRVRIGFVTIIDTTTQVGILAIVAASVPFFLITDIGLTQL